MTGNSFGKAFTLTTFGESHGGAVGGIVDGCPSGLEIDLDFIQSELNRRKPGQSKLTTQRKESDTVQILSGIFEGKTLGTPIGFIISNTDAKPKDYSNLEKAFRPSHADFTFSEKFGIRDYRGGGRSSARETACRVVGGAIAKLFLHKRGIKINAFVKSISSISLNKSYHEIDFSLIESNKVRCPDKEVAELMIKAIENAKKEGDSLGGIITCIIQNVPVGLGEPVFDKLHADLAKAMVSVNAVKGFEIGSGFKGTELKGSEHNDEFYKDNSGKISTKTNNSGGVQGGISNGEDIYFSVAFKPTATIIKTQKSLDNEGNEINLEGKGRHDPCVLPRAVPIVEAMSALVIADHLLRNRTSKL